MFCPSCGTQAPDGARFCGNCRNELQAQPAADQKTTGTGLGQVPRPSPEMPPTFDRPEDVGVVDGKTSEDITPMLKWGVVVASLFIPLVGIIMGLIYMNKQGASEEAKSVGKMWLIVGCVLAVLWVIGSSGGY